MAKSRARSPRPASMTESRWFIPDHRPLTTDTERTDRLADLLTTTWSGQPIVEIYRREIGVQGWEILYRPSNT